jgi:hypothetical protein
MRFFARSVCHNRENVPDAARQMKTPRDAATWSVRKTNLRAQLHLRHFVRDLVLLIGPDAHQSESLRMEKHANAADPANCIG